MNDYRVSVKVRNNRILKAIEEIGGTFGEKWCKKNNLSYKESRLLIALKKSPVDRDGVLTRYAQMLCEAVGKLPEELWSRSQIYALERNFTELELSHEQVVSLLPVHEQSYYSDFEAIDREQLSESIESALNTLTKKEKMAIKMRFFGDNLLEECANSLSSSSKKKVSRQDVWELQCNALNKLRNAEISQQLKEFLR